MAGCGSDVPATRYFNRELSQLQFNFRVLEQAQDQKLPLLERLRFLLIYTSNMDEFYAIRMSDVTQQVRQQVQAAASAQLAVQQQILSQQILPQLASQGLHLLEREHWDDRLQQWAAEYFDAQVAPLLTPIGLDPQHPFPLLVNKSLNFILELEGTDDYGRNSGLAIVPVPRSLPQLIEVNLDSNSQGQSFILLSSLIASQVTRIFTGMQVLACHPFRLTRNADLGLDADDLHELPQRLRSGLNARDFGEAVRLEVAAQCPDHLAGYLLQQLGLARSDLYYQAGPLKLSSLQGFLQLERFAHLKHQPFTPAVPPVLQTYTDIFSLLQQQQILLHHPYESFDSVLDFLSSAASDPEVLAIKQTLYRAGANSEVVDILVQAARNGKEVTVVVELRARFDEENNLELARRLEEAGAIVIYGVIGYKTHAKMALVIRREPQGLRHYVHLGTGNYHSTNAKLYTDYSLLSSDDTLVLDIARLFDQLIGMGKSQPLQQVLHAPSSLRSRLLELIDRECCNAEQGLPAQIIIKVNALTDRQIIDALYKASMAGVQIRLIVRGMCCLRPAMEFSSNIEVRSVVGRLLEHSRVYCFLNYAATQQVYLASADLMERNLDRRIEICFPLTDPQLAQRVCQELQLYLDDNSQAWILQPDASYKRTKPAATTRVDAQQALLQQLTVVS